MSDSVPDESELYCLARISRASTLDLEPRFEAQEDVSPSWLAELVHTDGEGFERPIGSARFLLFGVVDDVHSVWETCDADSGDLSALAGVLIDSDSELDEELFEAEPLMLTTCTLLIDSMEIDIEHRGKGLGRKFYRSAVAQILGERSALVATLPAPRDVPLEERTPADVERVRSFWRALGFVHRRDGVVVTAYMGDPQTDPFENEWVAAWRSAVQTPWAPFEGTRRA